MPPDGRPNRQRILDAAERLVIDNGFNATTLDHVIAAAGTSKGAFFHHFGGKTELAAALVERYVAGDLGHLHGALAATAAIADPRQRVLAFVDIFVEGADDLMSEQSSCLYAAVLAERQLIVQGATAAIAEAVVAWRVELAGLLREANAASPTPSPIDPEDLADHLFATFEGAFVLARALEDPGQMRSQLLVYRQLLEAALPSRPARRRAPPRR